VSGVRRDDNTHMDDRGQVLVFVVVALVIVTATFGMVIQIVYA
jgi:hypothetical protein